MLEEGGSISVVIIARNEEKMIGEAIRSAFWADEVLVINDDSIDKTVEVAKREGAKVVSFWRHKSFRYADLRNRAILLARGEWIFYLDADERITEDLKQEIEELRKTGKLKNYNAYAIPRNNYYLGRRVRYGGAYPDYVKRFFYRPALKRWTGQLHEEPIFEGELGFLKNPIEHNTHRDLFSMLEKTINWSQLEARELYRANHPKMVWWRFLRIMFSEFWDRGIKKQGFRDGAVGLVEVVFQMFSRFITYARLWELQQRKE